MKKLTYYILSAVLLYVTYPLAWMRILYTLRTLR